MTMTTEQAPRQNSEGDPCPPWCVTDHGKYDFHGSEPVIVEAPRPRDCCVRAILPYEGQKTQISVQSAGEQLWVDLGDAPDLAALVELLAGATPAQHRKLAAAIRQVAADITEAGQ